MFHPRIVLGCVIALVVPAFLHAQSADLGVTKILTSPPAGSALSPGQSIIYTITLTNNGPDAAAALSLSDVVPPGTTPFGFASLSGSFALSFNGVDTFTATTASFASGTTAQFLVGTTVNAGIALGTSITNTVSVTSATADPNLANNTASFTAEVGCGAHTTHGHISTGPPDHLGASHQHHGTHGHVVGAASCPPHAGPFHLTLDPADGQIAPLTEQPAFVAAVDAAGRPVSVLGNADRVAVAPGSILQLFGPARGLFVGLTDDSPAEAFAAPATSPVYHTTSRPLAFVGHRLADVLFSGLAPGQTGVWQINIRIPDDVDLGETPVLFVYEGSLFRAVNLLIQ